MKFLWLGILFFLQILPILCQTSLETIGLEQGAYKVGFSHYTAVDSTRTYTSNAFINNKKSFRPIPISIWHPIETNASEEMSIVDYMEILAEEEEWDNLPNDFILDWFYYQNTPENQKHLREKTKAFKNGNILDGKFPVILYAPSFESSSIENFGLSEMLASHGYIVISSPSRGSESLRFKKLERALETQARDIEFLIQEAGRLPEANLDKIGTIGFSIGGISNVLAQLRNSSIKATVSLDGTIRYNLDLLKSSPFYDLKKARVPFIHLAQKIIPDSVLIADKIDPRLNTDFEYYELLTECDAYKMRFHDLSHSYFSTLGVLFQKRDPRQDKSDLKIMESYKMVTHYTLEFLNAYLKDDHKALQFLNTQPQKLPNSQRPISLTSKKSSTRAKNDFYTFLTKAKQQNYQNLNVLYEKKIVLEPSLIIPEGVLNTLGLKLVFNPDLEEQGIRVLTFAVSMFPKSANLYDSLAEAYLHIDDTERAIEAFKKSLSLNPSNTNAIKRLKQLK